MLDVYFLQKKHLRVLKKPISPYYERDLAATIICWDHINRSLGLQLGSRLGYGSITDRRRNRIMVGIRISVAKLGFVL